MLKIDVRPYLVCLVASMFVSSSALAVPTNGNFEEGLDGWDSIGSVSIVEDTYTGNHYAYFEESFDSSGAGLLNSLTFDTFTIPAGTFVLSLDVLMYSEEYNAGIPDTDSFIAYLLNANTSAPLSDFYPDDDTKDWFYSIDTSVGEQTNAAVTGLDNDWRRVTLNFSLSEETYVLLAFDFLGEIDPAYDDDGALLPGVDGVITTVNLDNVNVSEVSVIPAPAALGLGLFGTGLVTLLRKSKKLCNNGSNIL